MSYVTGGNVRGSETNITTRASLKRFRVWTGSVAVSTACLSVLFFHVAGGLSKVHAGGLDTFYVASGYLFVIGALFLGVTAIAPLQVDKVLTRVGSIFER